MNNINKKLLIGFGAILVAVAIAFGYWYYQKSREVAGVNAIKQAGSAAEDLSKRASQGVLPSINPQLNPMENAPDTNPVSKTNPFSGIKTNPFK